MKKLIAIGLLTAMLVCLFGIQSFAVEESVKVYVTIANANGTLVMTQEEITVTDVDEDGSLTVNDALYLAHEAAFEGGAAAGYASESGEYGLSMTKFWGVENGGSYGYYVNNSMAMSLADIIEDGAYINAFVYSDTTAFSDTYCYFDVNTVSATAGQEFSLILTAAGYDENWAPVEIPVENAVITVDGEETAFTTDSEGKVTLTIADTGSFTISAKSTAQTLVPPVCLVTVAASTPKTSDNADYILYIALGAIAFAFIVFAFRRKYSYEK